MVSFIQCVWRSWAEERAAVEADVQASRAEADEQRSLDVADAFLHGALSAAVGHARTNVAMRQVRRDNADRERDPNGKHWKYPAQR